MIVVELDADGVKLEVALFGDYVGEVNNFFANGDIQQPVVVVQYAKVKTFRGKIVVQNVMFGTRLFFHPDIPEVVDFKNRLSAPLDDNSQSVAILPDPQYYCMEDDFLNSTPRVTIEQLKDCKEDGFYIVFATIKGVDNGPDWWYTACKCNKAVDADFDMYYCERCYCHVVHVIPRYRIKVRVMDDTDSATFIIWNRDGCAIVKKSCSDLLDSIQNPDFTVGSLGDTSLTEFQDIHSSVSKDLMAQFSEGDMCNPSQVDTSVADDTPAKTSFGHLPSIVDGDLSTIKLKDVKIEKD